MRPARFCLALACLSLPAAARAQTAGAPPPPPWETAAPAPAPAPAPALRTPGAPPAVSAIDTEGDGSTALARLQGTLAWFEGNQRSMRLAVGITGIAAGAAAIVTGAVLIDRGRRNDEIYGLMIGAGGFGMILGSAIGFFLNDPLQPVRDALEASAGAGFTPAQRVAAAEAEWARRAERSRRFRRIGGSVVLGLGAVVMGGGVALALTRESSSSSTTLHASGTLAIVTGALSAAAGAGSLFAPDPLEQSWEVYRRARGIGVDLAVAPVPGGAVATVGGVF